MEFCCQDYDAAVGDIAIVTNRTKIVDFTQPYISTGLVIVAPIRNSDSSAWVFLKPFTWEMWAVTAASFVIIGVVIWILEHRVNDDFRGPPKRQIITMFLLVLFLLLVICHLVLVSICIFCFLIYTAPLLEYSFLVQMIIFMIFGMMDAQ